MNIDPTHLNAQQLGALGAEAVDHLARRACGTLTCYRLLLGGVFWRRIGIATTLTTAAALRFIYACVVLGLKVNQARQFRHVATRLEELPALSDQAVRGLIAWCKLREVVRVASPETEEFWIHLCHHKTYERIERLVALTSRHPLDEDLQHEQRERALAKARSEARKDRGYEAMV